MKNLLILIAFAFLLTTCQQSNSSESVSANTVDASNDNTGKFLKVSVGEFKALLDEIPNEIVVDVRTPKEFGEGALEKAINIDFYNSEFDKEIAKLDKTKPIFIYCAKGGRSGKAMTKMQDLQFKEVYDLKGGYSAWKAENQ